MDDPVSQLANYKLQLGQVEAALTADESNEELITLRKDLEEIIEITEALIEETKQQVGFCISYTVYDIQYIIYCIPYMSKKIK